MNTKEQIAETVKELERLEALLWELKERLFTEETGFAIGEDVLYMGGRVIIKSLDDFGLVWVCPYNKDGSISKNKKRVYEPKKELSKIN